jgi:hypothetical protein
VHLDEAPQRNCGGGRRLQWTIARGAGRAYGQKGDSVRFSWQAKAGAAAAAVGLVVLGPSLSKGDTSQPVSGDGSSAGAAVIATGSSVVWAVGDLCDNDDAALDCDDVGQLIAGDTETDAVLALGDLQYETGALADFRRYYDRKMGRGRGLWSRTFPTPGNHEYRTANAAGYFDYWGARAHDRARGYYGFTVGGWQVVSANSTCAAAGGCGATSAQGRFIAGYLDRAGSCELVFDHHPAFSDGSHGDYPAGKALLGLTYQHRGELFLSGHDHGYQRFAPRRADGSVDAAAGVRQFVVGTGGAERTTFAPTLPRTEFRQNAAFGALRLELRPTGYTARFVSVDGTTMDTVSGTCRA